MHKIYGKILLCTLCFLSIFLCGCGEKSSDKLTFATWGSKSEMEILKPIIKQFEAENPEIKIELMHIPQNYFQKIHLLFASNLAPDVIFINNQYLPLYAKAGLLEDLSPYANKDYYFLGSIKALSVDNILYAIPRDVSTLVIYYNKDLFNQYKVPYPSPKWELNELLETAKSLTQNGVWGISFEEEPLFYLPYLTNFGGGILSEETGATIIDSAQSQQGLEFYANLRKKHHVAPLKSESASLTMAQLFLQEKIAMHVCGRWMVPKYRESAKFDWDVVNFPLDENENSNVNLDASGWAVAKSSKNKVNAIKFIRCLSSKENMAKFTESGLITPARVDVAFSSSFLDDKTKPYSAYVFLEAAYSSKETPISTDYRELLDKIAPKTERIFN